MGLDLLTEVTLPGAIMANGDILHGKPARQMPQDHHAGDQGVDALRRVAQNQVGGVLITAAEPLRQGVQLLAGEDAPLLRQAEQLAAQPQASPGCACGFTSSSAAVPKAVRIALSIRRKDPTPGRIFFTQSRYSFKEPTGTLTAFCRCRPVNMAISVLAPPMSANSPPSSAMSQAAP